MYNKFAHMLTKKMVENDIISKDNFDIYSYGFELLIAYVFYFVYLFLIALLTKTVLESVLFCFGFMIIRKYSGGVHASSYFKCQFLFVFAQLFFVFLINIFSNNLNVGLLIFVLISDAFLIWLFAPVDHKNKEFTEGEYKYFKNASRICLSITSFLSIVVYLLFDVRKQLFSFLFGTLFATVSVAIGYFKNKKFKY